jgi:hypothetical protein
LVEELMSWKAFLPWSMGLMVSPTRLKREGGREGRGRDRERSAKSGANRERERKRRERKQRKEAEEREREKRERSPVQSTVQRSLVL